MGVRADAGPDLPSPCAGGGLLLVTSPPEATSLILTAVFGILGCDDSEASLTCFIWLQWWWRGEIAHLDPPPRAQQAGNWKSTVVGFTAWLCIVYTTAKEFQGDCHFKNCSLYPSLIHILIIFLSVSLFPQKSHIFGGVKMVSWAI